MQMTPKRVYGPVIECYSLHATRLTPDQRVVSRRIGGRGHFRSRDKDDSHTFDSTCREPMIHVNFIALSSTEPELLLIEVLHCGNRELRACLQKIVDNIKKTLCSHSKRTQNDAKTRLLKSES